MFRARFQNNLIDIAMEGIIRKTREFTDTVEVIVLSVRVGTKALEVVS